MNILAYGIFQDHALGADILFVKGLRALGHSVVEYDFRAEIRAQGQQKADGYLLSLATNADLLLIGKGQQLNPAVLQQIHANTATALFYGDYRPTMPGFLKQLLPHIDCFLTTSGGEMLAAFHQLGVQQLSACIFNPFDPDILAQVPVADENIDVLFTGTGYSFAGDERQYTIDYLKTRDDVRFVGGADRFTGNLGIWAKLKRELARLQKSRKVRGVEYLRLIRQAKIGISVNATHQVPKYSSDRLMHYTGMGTFTLAHESAGIRELFADDELITFKNPSELAERIDYYLQNEREREEVAQRAQQRVLANYTTEQLARHVTDLVSTGGCGSTDIEVVK